MIGVSDTVPAEALETQNTAPTRPAGTLRITNLLVAQRPTQTLSLYKGEWRLVDVVP
jgi:hypothetical protein